jgi:HEPN domain-containing protein
MAKRDEDIRKFKRASEQRLRAAELLFEHEFYLEAIYIGGYAIECTLKQLILRRTPRNQHRLMLENSRRWAPRAMILSISEEF